MTKEDYTKKLLRLEDNFNRAKQSLFNESSRAIYNKLKEALDIYNEIPSQDRYLAIKHSRIMSILFVFDKELDASIKKTRQIEKNYRKTTRSKRIPNKTDDELLAFLKEPKDTAAVGNFLRRSAPIVGQRLKPLLKSERISVDKSKLPIKLWKAV